MRRMQASGHRRRGGVLIEMALLLPLLLLMLFGIIELSSIFYVRHNMVKAARAGARTLAVQDGTVESARQAVLRNLDHLPDIDFTISITQPPEGERENRDVIVELAAPVGDAALGDPLGILDDFMLRTQVVMRKEG